MDAPLRLRYDVQLGYQVGPGGADFIFNVQAARTPRQQVVWESLETGQYVALHEDVDPASAGRFLRLPGHNHTSMIAHFNTAEERVGRAMIAALVFGASKPVVRTP